MIAAERIDYLTDVDKALIRSILYFDIFDYPITAEEARAFAPFSVEAGCNYHLDNLVSRGILFKHDSFYSVRNDADLAAKRLKGNRLAAQRMKTARRYSRLIASFPFVRAVMLSGSISKNFMDETSDIDYFIVTESGRLWIVRTVLVVFRRIFFFNSLRNFCVNYFVDSNNMAIPDRNIFVATELVTLKSMYGTNTIAQFQKENKWVASILPQGSFDTTQLRDPIFYLKAMAERAARILPLDRLNSWLMNISKKRWMNRYREEYEDADFEIAFRCTEGISKCHPRFFQRRALDLLEKKIQAFEFQHGIDLLI